MSSIQGAVAVSIVGVEELLGSEVIDRDGAHIGELRDIMLDLRVARVAYGMVALDRPAESGERLVAVPWTVMEIDSNGDLRVNAPRDWIECAPRDARETGRDPC
jgi:sporulation protein YlmC with PRC-barrel domain